MAAAREIFSLNVAPSEFESTTLKYVVPSYPSYKSTFRRFLKPTAGWTHSVAANTPTTYGIRPALNVTLPAGVNGSFTFVVKINGLLQGKRTVNIVNGAVSMTPNTPINLATNVVLTNTSNLPYTAGFYIANAMEQELFEQYAAACGGKTAWIGYNWTANPNSVRYLKFSVESLYNEKFYAGLMYREWGQFFYNYNFNTNTTIPSDLNGKLVDFSLLESYNETPEIFQNINLEGSDCLNGGSDEEKEDCAGDAVVDQIMGENNVVIPEEITEENIDSINIDNLQSNADFSRAAVMIAKPIRYDLRYETAQPETIESYVGFFDSHNIRPLSSRIGKFQESTFGSLFPEDPLPEDNEIVQADVETGMYALTRRTQSVSRSFTAGASSISINKSNSEYSNLLSDFIDLNGDRYPDLMSSQKIQLTKMTGGLKPASNSQLGVLTKDESVSIRPVFEKSDLAVGRDIVKSLQQSTVSTTQSTSNNASADTGNPVAFLNMVSVNPNIYAKNWDTAGWVDINGDGLPDKLEYNSVSNSYAAKLNTGGTFTNANYQGVSGINESKPNSFSPSISFPIPSFGAMLGQVPVSIQFSAGVSFTGSDVSKGFLDLNGDGLTDMVRRTGSNTMAAFFNHGYGFGSATSLNNNSLDYGKNKTYNFSVGGSLEAYWGPTVCCWIIPIAHLKFGGTIRGNASLGISNSQTDFKDINGDGYLDFVERVGSNMFVSFSKIRRTNMLKSVELPTNAQFTIDYAVVSPTAENPSPTWVMSEVVTKLLSVNETNQNSVIPNVAKKTFSYENKFFDRRERTSFGFEKINTMEFVDANSLTVYRTTIQKFHNKNIHLEGLEIETKVVAGNNENDLLGKTENVYKIFPLNADGKTINTAANPFPMNFDVGAKEGRKAAAVFLTSTKQYVFENQELAAISQKRFEYNTYGLVSKFYDDGNTSDSSDNYSTEITYHDNSSAAGILNNNIIGVPKELKVFDSSGLMVRRRQTLNVSSSGLIGKIKAFTEVNNSASALETVMTYNADGLLASILKPSNQEYNYQYDASERKYVVKITDAFGYETESSFDYRFDKPIWTEDINDQRIVYAYDNIGRLTSVIGPNEIGTSPQRYTIKFQYYPTFEAADAIPNADCIEATSFNPFAVTDHLDVQQLSNPIRTISILDALGRSLQVKKDIEMNTNSDVNQTPSYIERMSSSGETIYDGLGRITKQFHPSFEEKSDCTNFLHTQDGQVYISTATAYDIRDRVIEVTDEDDNIIQYDYFSEGGLLATRVTAQAAVGAIVNTTFTDVQGRTVKQVANGGQNGEVVTTFNYSSIGELMQTTDPKGLSSTYTYDDLGRKLSYENPDSGMTQYGYDAYGNLETVKTAKLNLSNEAIQYSYQRGRLNYIKFPQGNNGQNISDVYYAYGSATAADPLSRGRLIYQEDATGYQTFNYGKLGEVIQNVRVITSPIIGADPEVFKTRYTYDSFNRLLNVTYPDDEMVRYRYNKGGKLSSIFTREGINTIFYVKRIDYDHYEQRTALVYGNNVLTKYDYSYGLRRLAHLNVKIGQDDFVSLSYDYDQIGNIISTVNSGLMVNEMGGSYHNNFEYDQLNRLVQASGSFMGVSSTNNPTNPISGSYNTSLTYDDTGALLTKNQNHETDQGINSENTFNFTYNYQENNHRPISVNDSNTGINMNYAYDANGNQTKRYDGTDTAFMLYYEVNRLRVVGKKPGVMQHNIYDANGERTLKALSDYEEVYMNGELVSPSTTNFSSYNIYVNPFYTKSNTGQITKHYFADNQRIASQISNGLMWQRPTLDANDMDAPTTEPQEIELPKEADFDAIKMRQQQDLNRMLTLKQEPEATFISIGGLGNPCAGYLPGSLKYAQCCAQNPGACGPAPRELFFYHPDHLGSSTAITDNYGQPYQFFLNLPFGETFIEQNTFGTLDNQYKFNGKELDTETGLYYYGARFYDPRVSFWYGVDPLVEKYPGLSPYNYCLNNPVMLVDPDGREPVDPLLVMKIRNNRASNLQGMVRNGGSRPHQGFDLAAKVGTPVLAVKNAVVHRVVKDEKAAYGNQIQLKITDENGKVTYAQYSHLSKIDVVKGQIVKEGDIIGATGVSGNASNLPEDQAHLHFELRDTPDVGKGLKGRLDPNLVLDTKFYTQDKNRNQTQTGVIKVSADGTKTKMNIDGTTEVISKPLPKPVLKSKKP